MGTVYRALDSSGNPVALKLIGSQAAINATVHREKVIGQAAALDVKRRMMLVREARVLMELDHPNIAPRSTTTASMRVFSSSSWSICKADL